MVGYRREFHGRCASPISQSGEALLDAAGFEDLSGKWQAAILQAEDNRPNLRLISSD